MKKSLRNSFGIFVLLVSSAFLSCGDNGNGSATVSDTMSAKDSMKKEIAENLPPSTNFKQFEWIYSSFVAAATYKPDNFDVFINKETGLWIIRTNGAMPHMERVLSVRGVMTNGGDSLVPMDHDKMICELRNEELPQPDCSGKLYWTKSGCFTSEENTFKTSRIWDYAALNENDSKKAEELAAKITRVVVNTEMNMRFYFAEMNGTWYLVFLDMRVPCSA